VELAKVDIVVFPTLWEGMPLSLMEVQAMGIPAVASAVGGNVDVVVDGHTGFLVSTDEQLISRTAALLDDHMERRRMSTNARNHAKANLSDAHLGTESLAIYASGHSRSKLQAAVL
jgi:glycosyltransferase involved in cell wall biosynthesis